MEYEHIVLTVENQGQFKQVEFDGQTLIDLEDAVGSAEPGEDAGARFAVFETKAGNIVVYVQHINELWGPILNVFDSFEEAEAEGIPADVLALAAGEESPLAVEELDI